MRGCQMELKKHFLMIELVRKALHKLFYQAHNCKIVEKPSPNWTF